MKTTNTANTPEVEQQSARDRKQACPQPLTPTTPVTTLSAPPVGRWTTAHWGLLGVALLLLIMAGQGQHFFRDDWAFVGAKLDLIPFPARYLMPHNEHWTLLPLLAYRTLRATAGVGSYWPYLGLLLLLHLSVQRRMHDSGFQIQDLRGIPAPLRKAARDRDLSRALLWLNQVLIRISPGLISRQTFVIANVAPDVACFLTPTRTRVEANAA